MPPPRRSEEAPIAAPDPLVEFGAWLDRAIAAGLPEPSAMTLATASAEARPSARIVLLKHFDERGFVFATNYRSAKAADLAGNPRAALVFCWLPLERQVRIEGRVEHCSPEESDRLFGARPREAQLAAWASPQSAELADPAELERGMDEARRRFPGTVPRPEHWGGYRLRPEAIEFWSGRPHRLHERRRYDRSGHGRWSVRRLAP